MEENRKKCLKNLATAGLFLTPVIGDVYAHKYFKKKREKFKSVLVENKNNLSLLEKNLKAYDKLPKIKRNYEDRIINMKDWIKSTKETINFTYLSEIAILSNKYCILAPSIYLTIDSLMK